MVNGIDEKKLQKHGSVKVFYFSSARINDMNHHLMPIIAKRPDYLILHVGTNDATTNTSRKIIDDLLMLKCHILKQLPNCRVKLHLNINSIRNKFESLVTFVGNNLDILMISETKIDDTFPESQFLIEGFSKPFRLDRTAKSGGILLYIREDIPCRCIKKPL